MIIMDTFIVGSYELTPGNQDWIPFATLSSADTKGEIELPEKYSTKKDADNSIRKHCLSLGLTEIKPE
jgi:hypothetical protein